MKFRSSPLRDDSLSGVPYQGSDIEVTIKGVTIEGILIPRPSRVSISQWLDFWERVRDIGQADY